MAFKHHSYFEKAKDAERFLYPHVCFHCRKSFKKPASDQPRRCPQCAGSMVLLNRKFSAPAATDKAQWKKVEFLVEHGFVFQTVYETPRGGTALRYPATLDEAREFVVAYAAQAIRRAA